jgi:small subunit ribosomal protein S6
MIRAFRARSGFTSTSVAGLERFRLLFSHGGPEQCLEVSARPRGGDCLREFETTYILQPEITDEGVGAVNARLDGIFEKGGSVRLLFDDDGKRRLAYEIAGFQKGHYVTAQYLDDGAVVPVIERSLRLDESVLRFLTVRIADRVTNIEERKEQAVEEEKVRAQRAAERAVRDAEEAKARAEMDAAREAEEAARAAEEAARAAEEAARAAEEAARAAQAAAEASAAEASAAEEGKVAGAAEDDEAAGGEEAAAEPAGTPEKTPAGGEES